MDQKLSVLDMHPFDASDLVCDMLSIPRKLTESPNPTFLFYAWSISNHQLETDELEQQLDGLVSEDRWIRSKKQHVTSDRDFVFASRWRLDEEVNGEEGRLNEYQRAVSEARYVWESLSFRNLSDDGQTFLRGAIGKCPYSSLCGLRVAANDKFDIEHVETGNLQTANSYQ